MIFMIALGVLGIAWLCWYIWRRQLRNAALLWLRRHA
jgi:hypothetical protein